jgi:hypothetical protein
VTTTTTGHSGHTPTTGVLSKFMRISQTLVLIKHDNTPIGDPDYECLDPNETILYLKKKIKREGEYKENLSSLRPSTLFTFR